MSKLLNRITPNLWFDNQAEEAARYYVEIFANSAIERVTRYGQDRRNPEEIAEGAVMTVEFVLDGQRFVGLNGGPQFSFNEAISFIVHCESQEEIDYYWEKLGEGGDDKAKVCGWLKDKFGVSWQVIPRTLTEWISGGDPEAANRVMKAMMPMKRLDMNALQQAYRG
jgi:predicted 3-demethylubiquinone-9 3-methyltransferase (glyoxalase superfamily)